VIHRRTFLDTINRAAAGAALVHAPHLFGQVAGERPAQAAGVTVVNPRARVPVGVIIDDSTCLVNLNKFAMPQFDTAFAGASPAYHKAWREWPDEIPDAFVRKFGEWAVGAGVKGKYSIVPFPACVGRVDRVLPGWTQAELRDSLELVRTVIMPNWDIHPEMVTHTRVVDPKTGHPFPETTLKFMENWEWTTGKSADQIGEYLAYALAMLRDAGLPCEGITTPGGFGGKAQAELSLASLQAVRSVFRTEIPHYFKYVIDRGTGSVAPRVENAAGLGTNDPQCVVRIIACTGDWTGGWDCSPPENPDRFITEDGKAGRMVEVIERGEPALILAHWTGIYWNGQELGLKVMQEVVRRLHARFDHLRWMKLSELARYWAAKELTQVSSPQPGRVALNAPFACPDFTLRIAAAPASAKWHFRAGNAEAQPLREVPRSLAIEPGAWCREGDAVTVCVPLPRGASRVESL